ncbi:hypothetical protein V491_01873 [Pseudogymnoascus sp. VKM F-3775]|nr:hypothetical protein V491_01873 [Pseudogymnoascus sp. VKM F-3775]
MCLEQILRRPPLKAKVPEMINCGSFFWKKWFYQPFRKSSTPLLTSRKNGLTLKDCLTILNIKGEVGIFAFYIHSGSMAAAVRLLTDESILVTYNLYCQNDPVVTILIRGIDEPSPNTSRAPSHQNSLAERRKVSRGALVPEIFIQPPPRHASGIVDVSTMEKIEDESEMVTINMGNNDFVTFTMEYLLCWITSQLDDGKSLTDIIVQSFGPDGVMRKVQLSTEIWQQSLIRGPWQSSFLPLWNDYNQVRSTREAMLASLAQEVPNFTQMCQNFIYDLHKFTGDKGARSRLDSTGHEFLSWQANGTLQDDLNILAAKRSEGEMCAAHDLSPLYETALGIKWDKSQGKGISLHQQMSGLSLQPPKSQGSKAKQLARKSSKFFKKTFGPKGGK